jgi:hypothetical protein
MVDWIKKPTMPSGGPPAPHPLEKAPHQDLGELVDGLMGGLKSAGETVCNFLDQPFDHTLKINGPHRIADNILDLSTGMARDILKKSLS